MTEQRTDHASCRFNARASQSGDSTLHVEVFHPVPSLAGVSIEFELLRGTTLEQTRKLAESLNERTIGIIVTTKGNGS
jgi:hypothetical protein